MITERWWPCRLCCCCLRADRVARDVLAVLTALALFSLYLAYLRMPLQRYRGNSGFPGRFSLVLSDRDLTLPMERRQPPWLWHESRTRPDPVHWPQGSSFKRRLTSLLSKVEENYLRMFRRDRKKVALVSGRPSIVCRDLPLLQRVLESHGFCVQPTVSCSF